MMVGITGLSVGASVRPLAGQVCSSTGGARQVYGQVGPPAARGIPRTPTGVPVSAAALHDQTFARLRDIFPG